MPKYQCHKKVWALKIKKVECDFDCNASGSCFLIPEDSRYGTIEEGQDYYNFHKPVAGGYYVVYKDGYKSFSPAEAFESGYTLI
jgi:hypothetical protein